MRPFFLQFVDLLVEDSVTFRCHDENQKPMMATVRQ